MIEFALEKAQNRQISSWKTRQLLPQLNLGKYKSTSLPSPGFIVLPKVSS